MYVTLEDVAAACCITVGDLRALRRILGSGSVPERRVAGSQKLHLEVTALIHWLRGTLPRLTPLQEQQLLDAARPASQP